MSETKKWNTAPAALIAVAALSLFAACAPPVRPPEPSNLFWPLPPDAPRIHYLQSIYTEDDIGREYSLKEKLFGKDYDDRMARPYSVTARKGKIIVSDIALRRVLIFDLAAKRMRIVGNEGALTTPASAEEGPDGTLYVADAGSNRVAVYAPDGKYRTAYVIKNGRPVALSINDDLKRIYVVDRANHRVVVMGLDGTFLFAFGSRGGDDGMFNIPLDITVDRRGQVYVLDAGNFRVQIFTADGKFLSKFGSVGDRPGMFGNPKGIAVDSEGHIYVTDAAFSNFQIFDQQGRVLLFVGSLGPWPGYFQLPAGISIDEQDRIYVADQLNARIEVFQYLKADGRQRQP